MLPLAANCGPFGDELVSPEGKTTRSLEERRSPDDVFSQDGTLLYGLRFEKTRQILFSIDLATAPKQSSGTSCGNRPGQSATSSVMTCRDPL